MKRLMVTLLLCLVAFAPAISAATSGVVVGSLPTSRIEREVRHELLMLPYYTIFDNSRFALMAAPSHCWVM